MIISSEAAMKRLGEKLGASLRGGELIELIGDVGAGKTTFTRGLAVGLGINDTLQSPTFTISRDYEGARGLRLVHYDFYRLSEAGIMQDELAESIAETDTVVVVEWSEVVRGVMPLDRMVIKIKPVRDDINAREVEIITRGAKLKKELEACTF